MSQSIWNSYSESLEGVINSKDVNFAGQIVNSK